MVITELEEGERQIWDNYVRNSPCGLPQHLSGWRDVMSKTYGYKTHFLIAKEGSEVMGVMPLFIVHSLLLGSSAMTMPGGLCADSDEAATALIERGMEIARQAKVKRLVLQDTRRVWPTERPLYTTSHHVHWVVDTRAGADALWSGLHKNIRRQVRMARKNGLVVEIDRTGERLGDFYDVLSRFAHNAGTLLFGQNFVEHIIQAFPGEFNIAVTYKEKQPIGAYFQLVMGKTVYGVWGATLHEYLNLRAVYLAYWEMLRDTAASGYEYLDMGRSPANSNTSKFKGQWGGVSRPIYQQVAAIGNDQAQETEVESIVNRVQTEAKFQRFMRVWSKLPFPVVQFLGPRLRRHVPFA